MLWSGRPEVDCSSGQALSRACLDRAFQDFDLRLPQVAGVDA
jgi:hypothetical protein